MAGWTKMPLGIDLGLGRRLCVTRRPSCPQKKRHSLPIFGPCLLWPNGWMDKDATWLGSRSRPRPHCVRRGPSSPPSARGTAPPLFGLCLLWLRSPISATAELLLHSSRSLQRDCLTDHASSRRHLVSSAMRPNN